MKLVRTGIHFYNILISKFWSKKEELHGNLKEKFSQKVASSQTSTKRVARGLMCVEVYLNNHRYTSTIILNIVGYKLSFNSSYF